MLAPHSVAYPCTRRPVFAYKVYRKYAEQAHSTITMVPAAGVFGSEHSKWPSETFGVIETRRLMIARS